MAVTVTITGGKVTNVDIDASGETPELGGKAAESLTASLKEAGSTAGVDAVTGSTMTSDAVFAAMDDCLAQAATAARQLRVQQFFCDPLSLAALASSPKGRAIGSRGQRSASVASCFAVCSRAA